jgi:two-component system response regulator HydG
VNAANDLTTICSEVLPGVISQNKAMKTLAAYLAKIALSDGAVFLHGETGTGKDLIAQAIHQKSGRLGRIVSVNCGAIPEKKVPLPAPTKSNKVFFIRPISARCSWMRSPNCR